MKKSVWIFFLAVLLPSVVLGWLALRSAEEQQIILERQTAELYQKETENAAAAVRALIDEERRAFNDTVRRLLAGETPPKVAGDFPGALEKSWSRKAIGFAIGPDGRLLSPTPQRAAANPSWQKFLLGNGSFLAGTTPATVYWVSGEELAKPEQLRKNKGGYDNALAFNQGGNVFNKDAPAGATGKEIELKSAKPAPAHQAEAEQPNPQAADPAPAPRKELATAKANPGKEDDLLGRTTQRNSADLRGASAQSMPAPQHPGPQGVLSPQVDSADASNKQELQVRNVAPQRLADNSTQTALSQLMTVTTDFRALTTGTNDGVVTRYVQDQLEIIFWLRPAQAPDMIFGCLIAADTLRDLWPAAFPASDPTRSYDSLSRSAGPDFVLALLDDRARPVATQPTTTQGRDWKRPFVASEIGEALPHWEAALYLQRPEQIRESARVVRRTLVFFIAAALAVIALGGWLVAADVRRQLALAQQKTDFVSNVSHELKTPLTSIRMFAELMQNGRGDSTAKHPQYLRIIMVEAERLTRLINNVLDFARLERKQKQFDKKPLDLHAVVERTWESHELHLQEGGFTTRWQAAPGPYPVIGDEDALAQILVNLLSNAEKYAGERKEVELHSYLDTAYACVSVLDRGLGVSPSDERKIFESFYRAHDSLSSGIQGSGLGLTLAQRLAQEHGGEILYQPRAGGGSNFTLRVPLATKTS
jgi:signal transduction histidine kinase